MRYYRPDNLLAGFHASMPDPAVSELEHAGEQWAPTTLFIDAHEHTVWEFYLQLDGTTEWISGRSRRGGPPDSYVLHPGAFFAAPPHVVHSMKHLPRARHHFYFAGIDLESVFKRHVQLRDIWQNALASAAGRCLHMPGGHSLQQPFRQLIREVSMMLPLRSQGLRTSLDYVVIEASRLLQHRHGGNSNSPFLAIHPAVEKVRDLLDHHYAQPWRLADLGHLANISPNHLVQVFTKEIGISPHQYLLRQRIERAKELLRDSDLSITQIAMDLGFSSSQHFARSFRQAVRMPAARFRKTRARRV
ncbi:MAG: helix-turn-helix transcriptional regulator [Phycisphaerales bacterium]|jgi:AraC-like DNA-binding protein|nr:helix-turn-helix transcriptional regulator [Phycisphaerales bacterium]